MRALHVTRTAQKPKRTRAKQDELPFRTWGGARKGAGRKPKGPHALVPHETRPAHKARFPLLVTTRLRPGLPSLRHTAEAARIRAALANACASVVRRQSAAKSAGGSAPFQVVHHSIQSNHIHLIVEAEDRASMTRGMRGLLVRIARALNRLWKRRGSVFSDRFHERELRTPKEVRNALVYVLQNLRKHGIHLPGPDPYSSGPEFHGWRALPRSVDCRGAEPTGSRGGSLMFLPLGHSRAARLPVPPPNTWLLNVGWQRHGLLALDEHPRAGRSHPTPPNQVPG